MPNISNPNPNSTIAPGKWSILKLLPTKISIKLKVPNTHLSFSDITLKTLSLNLLNSNKGKKINEIPINPENNITLAPGKCITLKNAPAVVDRANK
tara:strand:+ start:396 stop:683 length:288 start_codon:yes stop_codon:yes gene_type:complete